MILAQIYDKLSCRQAKCPKILSQNGQNDLEAQCQKANDFQFQYQLRVSQDACLVQFWWFQLKSVMSYHVDKVKFTDRRTDRWTDTGNDNTTSAWRPWGKNQIDMDRIILYTYGEEFL